MKRAVALAIVSLAFSLDVCAAPAPPPAPLIPTECRPLVDAVRHAGDADARRRAATELVKMNLRPECLSMLILANADEVKLQQMFAEFLKRLESKRTDKQVGTSAGAGGTTSLVAKGTTAKVLSMATEYGALTESVNSQTVTVQGSLDGVPAALVRHNVFPYCPPAEVWSACAHHGVFDWLGRVSYAVSFDTSQGATGVTGTTTAASAGSVQPVTFEANGHQVTAASAKFVVVNHRDATSKAFQDAWKAAIAPAAATAATAGANGPPASPLLQAARELRIAMGKLLDAIDADREYLAWQTRTIERLASAGDADLDAAWAERAQALTAIIRTVDPAAPTLALSYAKALDLYRFEEDQLVTSVAEQPVMTLQYDYKRPIGMPPTSTLRLVFDKGLDEHWSVTANGAVEYYDQVPPADIPGARRLRDAQFGVQLQYDLGKLAVLGAAAVSGTYYFQYQNSPSILDVTAGAPLAGISLVGLPGGAQQVFADKGNLSVAQVRLVLGPSGSSARFPIAVSYSNRTELITKPVWRAQIGVSYDFDSLFAK